MLRSRSVTRAVSTAARVRAATVCTREDSSGVQTRGSSAIATQRAATICPSPPKNGTARTERRAKPSITAVTVSGRLEERKSGTTAVPLAKSASMTWAYSEA